MKIGFTGTRNGMTEDQKYSFRRLISAHEISHFHHGDCIGADSQAADMIDEYRKNRKERTIIISHPPTNRLYRAFNKKSDLEFSPKSYYTRNRYIVANTTLLVACPKDDKPILPSSKGGTAYTVRFARMVEHHIVIIWPNGSTTSEKGPLGSISLQK